MGIEMLRPVTWSGSSFAKPTSPKLVRQKTSADARQLEGGVETVANVRQPRVLSYHGRRFVNQKDDVGCRTGACFADDLARIDVAVSSSIENGASFHTVRSCRINDEVLSKKRSLRSGHRSTQLDRNKQVEFKLG